MYVIFKLISLLQWNQELVSSGQKSEVYIYFNRSVEGGGCNQQSNPDGSPGAGPGGSNGGTPIPYLTFIVGTDHSLLAVWQQYRPIGAVWLL